MPEDQSELEVEEQADEAVSGLDDLTEPIGTRGAGDERPPGDERPDGGDAG